MVPIRTPHAANSSHRRSLRILDIRINRVQKAQIHDELQLLRTVRRGR